MNAKHFAVSLLLLVGGLLAFDWLKYWRPLDIMGAPLIAVATMTIASCFIFMGSADEKRPAHVADMLRVQHSGNWRGFVLSVPTALVLPRIGVPLLAMAIAHYRGMKWSFSLVVALICSAAVEILFIRLLGVHM